MTFQEFAASIRDSTEYRNNVRQRACAGMLPADVELFLLEMADGRTPMFADRLNTPGVRQGPSLAFIRPARNEEV